MTSGLNPHNFEGRVFNKTPHESYYAQQAKAVHLDSYHRQSAGKSFDLYERSRSIDSIKVMENEPDSRNAMTAAKRNSPFSLLDKAGPRPQDNCQGMRQAVQRQSHHQGPIFTHEIPEVYSIMVKNNNHLLTRGNLSRDNEGANKEHVSTPQFQG